MDDKGKQELIKRNRQQLFVACTGLLALATIMYVQVLSVKSTKAYNDAHRAATNVAAPDTTVTDTIATAHFINQKTR